MAHSDPVELSQSTVIPSTWKKATFNGDGIADLVSVNAQASSISVLIGRGDGTFDTTRSYATGATTDGGVTVGDVNGDGNVDILTADYDTNVVSLFLGAGNGTSPPELVSPLQAVHLV